MAHNLARWTARIGLGERIATTKTLRRRFFSLAGRLTRSARRLTLHLPDRWPWAEKFSRALARLRAIHSRPDGTVGDPPTGQPMIPADSRQPGPREFPAAYSLAIPRIAAPADGHRGPCAAMKTVRRPPYPKWNPGYFPCSSLTPLPLSSRRPSVSFGGFGLRVNTKIGKGGIAKLEKALKEWVFNEGFRDIQDASEYPRPFQFSMRDTQGRRILVSAIPNAALNRIETIQVGAVWVPTPEKHELLKALSNESQRRLEQQLIIELSKTEFFFLRIKPPFDSIPIYMNTPVETISLQEFTRMTRLTRGGLNIIKEITQQFADVAGDSLYEERRSELDAHEQSTHESDSRRGASPV